MKRVSFDFDSTLELGNIQAYAKKLRNRDIDLWIVTTRYPDGMLPWRGANNHLWYVAESLNIPKEKVVFTSHVWKWKYFLHHDFIFHVDDDIDEVNTINKLTHTHGILHVDVDDWEDLCDSLLENKITKTI